MFLKNIAKNVTLATGAVTDGSQTSAHVLGPVDFNTIGETREFIITAKFKGNATAPGASRTVGFSVMWCEEKITAQQVIDELLANRAPVSFSVNLRNAVNFISRAPLLFNDVSAGSELETLRPKARYLYLAYFKTTEDGGAVTTLESLDLVKVRDVGD